MVTNFKDLIVYKKAHNLAMKIFELSQKFPKEEKYSLTDQMRRSSRSVSSCIAESWAKRLYIKAFVNKLTDCKYITKEEYKEITSEYQEVHKMIISMINNPEKWCLNN